MVGYVLPSISGFDNPLLASARRPSNSPYMQLDRLEWRCPVWEDDALPSMWIKSIRIIGRATTAASG